MESVSRRKSPWTYDRYKEVQLSLEPNIQYTVAEDYYAPTTPTLSTDPDHDIRPESAVNRVARAALVYSFSDPLTQSKSISCKVTLYDVNGDVIGPG